MTEIGLMHIDSNSACLFSRDARCLILMINCTVDKLSEQLKLDIQELLERFFLLVNHVIAKIGNVVVGWVFWALRLIFTVSMVFTFH